MLVHYLLSAMIFVRLLLGTSDPQPTNTRRYGMNRNHLDNHYWTMSRLEIKESVYWALRRASMTLNAWFEKECGDSNNYCSWCIERDPETDRPFMVVYPHESNKVRKTAIPDREKGARKRITDICKENNLHFYIQDDPRGVALYVSRSELTDKNYNTGFGIGK